MVEGAKYQVGAYMRTDPVTVQEIQGWLLAAAVRH